MDLIDSHAHMDVSDFDADREAMLERARAAGVGTLLAIGNGPELEKLGAAVPYAEQHDWIYAAMGIHPHEAKHATEAHYAELDRLARNPRVIAWGEIGLDYHYDHSPRDVQAQVFRRQLEQARAAQRPVIIHCREAWPDCLKILDEDWRSSGLGGIFHCFAGTMEEARAGMDMGFLDFVRGKCDLSEGAEFARRCAGDSPRPLAGGNRFAVSCAAAAPGAPERAGLCRGSGANHRECEKLAGGRGSRGRRRKIFAGSLVSLDPAIARGKFREERHLTSDGEGNF